MKCNTDLVIFADSSAPLPEGEHHPAGDEAPAADSKDTADEKLDGKWSRNPEGFIDELIVFSYLYSDVSFGDTFFSFIFFLTHVFMVLNAVLTCFTDGADSRVGKLLF